VLEAHVHDRGGTPSATVPFRAVFEEGSVRDRSPIAKAWRASRLPAGRVSPDLHRTGRVDLLAWREVQIQGAK
jgi:hypothetical protein